MTALSPHTTTSDLPPGSAGPPAAHLADSQAAPDTRTARRGLRRVPGHRLLVAIVLSPIRAYQWVSGRYLPACCRYTPTCSEFMIQAIRQKGIVPGLLLGIFRIIRCNPFIPGGWDPPEAWWPRRRFKLPWPRPPWPDNAFTVPLKGANPPPLPDIASPAPASDPPARPAPGDPGPNDRAPGASATVSSTAAAQLPEA